MRTVAIITARNTSRRLPGKATVDIGGRPALSYLIERLKTVPALADIVIATTANPEDRSIHDVAKAAGVKSVSGSEHDVLGRVALAARSAEADTIVYCTGDCIFLDPAVVAEAIKIQKNSAADFVSNCIPRTYVGGMDVEVFGRSVLERLDRELTDPWDREHITEHIYLRPLRYKARYFHAPSAMTYPHLQVCLDTEEDLRLLRSMQAALSSKDAARFSVEDMVAWLLAHPAEAQTNAVTRKRSYALGIAGLGRVAWNPESTPEAPDYWTHVDAIGHIPDLLIKAVADTDLARLAAFAKRYGGVAPYGETDDMLAKEDLDAVYVCTPTPTHVAVLEAILEKTSIPLVVCEKPLSNELSGARRMAEAYAKAGRRLVVNYWPRWSDSHTALKSAISGIGEIEEISRLYSLGLFNSGSYAIDQLRDLFGEIRAVQAVSSVKTVREGDDGISATVFFEGNMPPAHLKALSGHHVTSDTDVIGRLGRLRLTENDTELEAFAAGGQSGGQLVRREAAHFSDLTPFLGLSQSVVNALRFGREPPLTAFDALRAVEICDAIRVSSMNGNSRQDVSRKA